MPDVAASMSSGGRGGQLAAKGDAVCPLAVSTPAGKLVSASFLPQREAQSVLFGKLPPKYVCNLETQGVQVPLEPHLSSVLLIGWKSGDCCPIRVESNLDLQQMKRVASSPPPPHQCAGCWTTDWLSLKKHTCSLSSAWRPFSLSYIFMR